MLLKSWLLRVSCTAMLLFALVGMSTSASAQNVLVNPSFESGLTGWTAFANVYPEVSNPPQFVPLTGNGLVSMFGNWWGSFNVSGIFQEFPCSAGDQWRISSNARFWSGDPMIGSQAAGGNWVVQKVAFFFWGLRLLRHREARLHPKQVMGEPLIPTFPPHPLS